MRIAAFLATVLLAACKPGSSTLPPASPDQTVAAAMRLVCEAPTRAARDHGDGTRSDKIAAHLTDGIGNVDVLTTVEGWKTDGIKRAELDRLLGQAKLAPSACKLSQEAP
jgi:hypothetical protein